MDFADGRLTFDQIPVNRNSPLTVNLMFSVLYFVYPEGKIPIILLNSLRNAERLKKHNDPCVKIRLKSMEK